jgi:hypothetical protein
MFGSLSKTFRILVLLSLCSIFLGIILLQQLVGPRILSFPPLSVNAVFQKKSL